MQPQRDGVDAGMTYLLLRRGEPVATVAVEQDTPPPPGRTSAWTTSGSARS